MYHSALATDHVTCPLLRKEGQFRKCLNMCSPPSCWAENQVLTVKAWGRERTFWENTAFLVGCVFFFSQATDWAEYCLGRLDKEPVKHCAQTICKVGHRKMEGMQSWRRLSSDMAGIENIFYSEFICTSFISMVLISSGPAIWINSLKKTVFLYVKARSPEQLSQVSLTPATAYLVTKGCLSDWCGFLCEHTFSSVLGVFFTPNSLFPNFPLPPLAFFLDLEHFGFWGPSDLIPCLSLPTEAECYLAWGWTCGLMCFFWFVCLGGGDGDSTLAHTWASSSIYRCILVTFPQLSGLRAISKKLERRWWIAWKVSADVPSCSARLSHPGVLHSSPLLTCPSWPRLGHNPLCCSKTSPSQSRSKSLTTAFARPFLTSCCERPGQPLFSVETHIFYS